MSIPTSETLPRLEKSENVIQWTRLAVERLEKHMSSFAMTEFGTTVANGANNNLNIGNGMLLIIKGPTAAFNITGFGGGSSGRVITLYNGTGQTLLIREQNAGSSAANRIITAVGDITVTVVSLVYSDQVDRWICFSIL